MRTFKPAVQDMIERRMGEIVDGVAAMHGAHGAARLRPRLSLHPQPRGPDGVRREGRRLDVSGADTVNTEAPPVMGAEDFSYMLEARPGAFVFVGNGDTAGLHHPAYDFDDRSSPSASATGRGSSKRRCRPPDALRRPGAPDRTRNAKGPASRRAFACQGDVVARQSEDLLTSLRPPRRTTGPPRVARCGDLRVALAVGDEVGDARRDLGAEARAVEDAVVADLGLHVVRARSSGMFGQSPCAASVWPTPEMSSFSPSTVIRRDAADRREVDRLAAMHHLALGQACLTNTVSTVCR